MDLINIGIIITYIMIFGAALAVVVFSVMQMPPDSDSNVITQKMHLK